MAASVLFLASRAFPSWVGTTWQLDYKKGARFEQDEYRHKIRNPNLEIRNKSEAQNPKEPPFAFRVLGFEHSGLFRISRFGFRIWQCPAITGRHATLAALVAFPTASRRAACLREDSGARGRQRGGWQRGKWWRPGPRACRCTAAGPTRRDVRCNGCGPSERSRCREKDLRDL